MCDVKDAESQNDDSETKRKDSKPVILEKDFGTGNQDGASVKPLLKRLPRSQKKRLKQELATQRKKEMRKEKKQLQKQKLKERVREEKEKNNLEEGVVLPTRKELKEEIKSKLETALMCGQRICVDLSMENTMTTKEKGKLAQQLCRLYGVNKKADLPAHVYFAGFDKNGELYQECTRKIDGFEKYQVEMTDAPVLEIFDHKDIVYLTPDAEEMLEDLDKDKVYVIGGIVDESIIKNLSKQRADAANLPTCRLPIDRYMKKKDQIHFSQVLAINQVFEILVTYLSSKDWRAALSRGVPERKGYIMKE